MNIATPPEPQPATERWCIIGPTHPFRGGIPRHTALFADAVASAGLNVKLVSFIRQYPQWLYKGHSDRDPNQVRGTVVHPDYQLDSLAPHTWWRAARVIDQHAPDVVVVIWWHPFFAPMVSSLLTSVRRHRPGAVRIALCHNVLPHETSRADRSLTRLALSRADGLVIQASSQEPVVRDLLGNVPVLLTPHPTYMLDRPRRTGPRRLSDDVVHLLFFGLIREYKGLDLLLRALPRVLEQRRVRLVVAGEFWDPIERYIELIRELDLEQLVDLREGYVPDGELPRLFDDADLMVAPYQTATQSGVVEMAFGAGVPVIASDVGGLAEQVDSGVNGLLVPPNDQGALSRAVVEATEPATLDRLTAGARAPGTVHTWDRLADDIKKFAATLRAESGDLL